MKRAGNLMEKILDLDNLIYAAHKAFKGKRHQKEVLAFKHDFTNNIQQLREKLATGRVEIGNYHYFTIYDPKERLICAASLEERIVHHAIMNVCHEYFDRRLIDDCYATRPGKGVYAALEKVKIRMKRHPYYVKLDVRKYYDSIDHAVLKDMLRRVFKDVSLLSLFDRIIDSYHTVRGKGLPIGNLTSQYFANLYLSGIDHEIKERVQVPLYVRYMDDVLMLGDDAEKLRKCVTVFCDVLRTRLLLEVKPPIYGKSPDGVVFLGYKVMPGYLLLSGRSKRRFRHKLIKYDKDYRSGAISEATYGRCLQPLLAFVGHALSSSYRRSCIKQMG